MVPPGFDRERMKEVLAEALNWPPGAARVAWLAEALDGAPEILAEARGLLAAFEGAEGDFLAVGARGSAPALDQLGPYRILGLLGAGGMAFVYAGHGPSGPAAIKILRPELRTMGLLQRFALERRVLQRLSHEHIARVLDQGEDPTYGPWLALERLDGGPITTFAESRGLSIEDRVRLFLGACAGVQYAHARGFLHRDVKPSNLLVDSSAVPPRAKVIDFGIARGFDAPDSLFSSPLTSEGQIVGTLESMSPEQLDPDAPLLDVRSDVYSLGVVLYELLSGHLPLPRRAYREHRPSQLLRLLRSTRFDPPTRALTGRFEFDPRALDCVTLKALEVDPERRYATVQAFAQDLERVIAGRETVARPPTPWVRVRSFVRRHRGPTIAVSAVMLSLATGLVSTLLGWREAERRASELAESLAEGVALTAALTEKEAFARDLAGRLERSLEETELQLAGRQVALTEAEAIGVRLRDLLFAARPERLGPEATLKAGLVHYAERLIADEALPLFALARIGEPVGETLVRIGESELAARLLGRLSERWTEPLTSDRDRLLRGRMHASLAGIAWDRGDLLASDAAYLLAEKDLEPVQSNDGVSMKLMIRGQRRTLIEIRGDLAGAIQALMEFERELDALGDSPPKVRLVHHVQLAMALHRAGCQQAALERSLSLEPLAAGLPARDPAAFHAYSARSELLIEARDVDTGLALIERWRAHFGIRDGEDAFTVIARLHELRLRTSRDKDRELLRELVDHLDRLIPLVEPRTRDGFRLQAWRIEVAIDLAEPDLLSRALAALEHAALVPVLKGLDRPQCAVAWGRRLLGNGRPAEALVLLHYGYAVASSIEQQAEVPWLRRASSDLWLAAIQSCGMESPRELAPWSLLALAAMSP